MIEFTVSRVVLMACGVMVLLSVTGVLDGGYDMERDSMDDSLAGRLAYMLDIFQSSENDELIVDGSMILPQDYHLKVHSGFVELCHEDSVRIAETMFTGEFQLEYGEVVKVTRRTSQRSS